MGLQKYYANKADPQDDGAIVWRNTQYLGGPSVASVQNCRLENLQGDMRAMVYVQGEADTWFSIPAKFYLFGKVLNGYLTGDGEGNLVCRHCYY